MKTKAPNTNHQLDKDSLNTGVLCSILHSLRVKSGLTRQELANRTNLSYMHLSKIEDEQDIEIRISTLISILDALGYDLLFQPRAIRVKNSVKRTATKKAVKTKRR